MAKYVDGYVIAIPKENLEAYTKIAKLGGKVWRKYGALDYKECVAEDIEPDMGGMKYLPFTKLAKLKEGETLIFAFIVYKSRKHRDAVNAKVMKDPLMNDPQYHDKGMPFKMTRMSWGGFDVIVDT